MRISLYHNRAPFSSQRVLYWPLGMAAPGSRIIALEDGEVVARPRLDLTLSCDHRTIDGATASEFLGTVKDFLEEPGLAL